MSRKAPITRSYVLYARGRRELDTHPRVHVVSFERAETANAWLNKMMGKDPIEPMENRVLINGWITVTCDRMTEVHNAEAKDERLPDQYVQWIGQFKYGSWDERPVKDEVETVIAEDGSTVVKRAPKAVRATKAQRPDGYITITDLCATLGMPAMNARAILRASDMTKPDYGWAFAPKEVPKIKKLLGVK